MYVRQHPTYRRLSAHVGHAGSQQPGRLQAERTAADFTGWERIGRGGFGKVYRAQPRARLYPQHPQVAIKVVDKRALKDSAAEHRLAAEVAIHGSLSHPHVLPMLDSFEDDRYVYMVMEYCEHGDLWKHLRQRGQGQGRGRGQGQGQWDGLARLSETEARWVTRQIVEALAYMHSCGVLHRDLKLANIMLGRGMQVRLGDFGLATWVGAAAGEPVTMCGTPSYISPEIMARQPYGLASDVWALGCLLVTLLTGAQPFRGVSKITSHTVHAVPLPPTLSSEARHLVRALLRVDPRQRLSSSEILAHPFFNSMLVETPLAGIEEPGGGWILGRGGQQATARHEAPGPSTRRRPHSADPARPGPPSEAPTAQHPPASAMAAAQPSPTLSGFSTRRLQAPLKRALKNGKLYLRKDRLLLLDQSSSGVLVGLDEQSRCIYEFERPPVPYQLDRLDRGQASRRFAWSLQELPDRVAKGVRMAIRCTHYLLSQQKRIRLLTPQGKAYLFDDQQTFKLLFFNGIRVVASRLRMDAVVEIPSKEDLPNEIQKVQLVPQDFEGSGQLRECRVPEKVRGIMAHVRESMRRAWAFDAILCGFEPGGYLHERYEGQIRYPVNLDWNSSVLDQEELDYVPPGLAPKAGGGLAKARGNRILEGVGKPVAARQSSMAQTTTVISNAQKQQWGAHVLDRRTVDDTPTRRLNLGPITRLVEEFNQPNPATPLADFLHTPGSAPNQHVPHRDKQASRVAQQVLRQTFGDSCFMPQIGWCMAIEGESDYVITMLFVDGCRVLVNAGEQSVCFKDEQAEFDDLPIDHSIPDRVKERLAFLPQFLTCMGLAI
ncbi:hypothetical protein LPJ78_001413 [Coemansia sp. RSA 989]|nr:hypothetical protein LPJ79_001533 [Coemansia sp. RSA 1821]KAJ1866989.1 hypothetical protein LPJ78_001413 [Coemansia sp. RSA 989]KAJ1874223.1 hypothetical protein LPJ55_001710 [Coemansia sp. RSA 990]KAJ2670882.1 hypothetical protein IWW42_003751 [Coemansia sp. RSA 1085]